MKKSENKDLTVKKARNGRGVFAERGFKENEVIYKVKGKLISCDLDEKLDEETRNNTYRYNEEMYLDPKGTMGDFFNHSCNPNSKIIKKGKGLFIISLGKIKKGKEIVFDYSTILADDDIWEMKCDCGNLRCRKIVKKFSTLPKKIKKKYISLDAVPGYIVDN